MSQISQVSKLAAYKQALDPALVGMGLGAGLGGLGGYMVNPGVDAKGKRKSRWRNAMLGVAGGGLAGGALGHFSRQQAPLQNLPVDDTELKKLEGIAASPVPDPVLEVQKPEAPKPQPAPRMSEADMQRMLKPPPQRISTLNAQAQPVVGPAGAPSEALTRARAQRDLAKLNERKFTPVPKPTPNPGPVRPTADIPQMRATPAKPVPTTPPITGVSKEQQAAMLQAQRNYGKGLQPFGLQSGNMIPTGSVIPPTPKPQLTSSQLADQRTLDSLKQQRAAGPGFKGPELPPAAKPPTYPRPSVTPSPRPVRPTADIPQMRATPAKPAPVTTGVSKEQQAAMTAAMAKAQQAHNSGAKPLWAQEPSLTPFGKSAPNPPMAKADLDRLAQGNPRVSTLNAQAKPVAGLAGAPSEALTRARVQRDLAKLNERKFTPIPKPEPSRALNVDNDPTAESAFVPTEAALNAGPNPKATWDNFMANKDKTRKFTPSGKPTSKVDVNPAMLNSANPKINTIASKAPATDYNAKSKPIDMRKTDLQKPLPDPKATWDKFMADKAKNTKSVVKPSVTKQHVTSMADAVNEGPFKVDPTVRMQQARPVLKQLLDKLLQQPGVVNSMKPNARHTIMDHVNKG